MAPHIREESVSSSDEEGPESIPLSQSKKRAQKQNEVVQKAQNADKQRKRDQNRERDRKLKERAEENKVKRRHKDAEIEMPQEGEQADEEKDGVDEMDDSYDEGGEFVGFKEEDDTSMESNSNDGSLLEEESMHIMDATPRGKRKSNPNHLPDELFAAAFTAKRPSKITGDHETKKHERKPLKKKRKDAKGEPKDLIIGSRVIRALQDTERRIPKLTAPSRKVNKFLDRALGLKNGPKNRGWERRPANIGVLRTNGPAASFVRNKI